MSVKDFIIKLFCGPPYSKKKVFLPKNFYQRQAEIVEAIWNCKIENDFGIERILRLFCTCFQFLSLANFIRYFWGRFGFKARKLSVDIYVLLNVFYPLFIIKEGLWSCSWCVIFLVYLTSETIIYLLNLVVLKPYLPSTSSYTRNLLLIFLNFLQVAFAFAVFYLNAGMEFKENSHVGLQAVYYSIVTQTTVGFGDVTPSGECLLWLTIIQIIVSLLFVYLFFAFMISHIGVKTFMSNKS